MRVFSITENIPLLLVNFNVSKVTDQVGGNPVDIRAQQDSFNKRFTKVTLSTSDKMEDLCRLLKPSNAPMVLFDRIINWVQRHKGVTQNGTNQLMKGEMFLE